MSIYRNLTSNVSALGNDADAILKQAGLDWKACRVPLFMHGKQENRPYAPLNPDGTPMKTKEGAIANQRYAIVNCSNGRPIDGGKPVSKNFKLVDNREVVTDMCTFASDAGLTFTQAGSIDGGRLVIMEAQVPGTMNLHTRRKKAVSAEARSGGYSVGDLITGGVVVVASHEPGRSTRVKGFARRLACMNGATVTELMGAFSMSHRQKYSDNRERLRGVMDKLSKAFGIYVERVNHLVDTDASRLVQTAHVMQAVQPSLLAAVIDETVKQGIVAAGSSIARFVIDSLQSIDAVEGLLKKHMQDEGSRALHKILETLDTQPGVEHCAGSLAQSYNAVTHYVDHLYGRKNNQDGAVEFGLLGKGDAIKESALKFGTDLWAVAQHNTDLVGAAR